MARKYMKSTRNLTNGSRTDRRQSTRNRYTPEWVLQSNFRLTCANLLKSEQLEEKSRPQVAVQQPEVNAGELVDS
jgi:hypothetical protein